MAAPLESSEDRKRRLARERQQRRRQRLAEQHGPITEQRCIVCGNPFTPKHRDARCCSAKCINERSYCYKRALAALEHAKAGASFGGLRWQSADQLRRWWRGGAQLFEIPEDVRYLADMDLPAGRSTRFTDKGWEASSCVREWFPDLCADQQP